MISDLLLAIIPILFLIQFIFFFKTLYYKYKYHYYSKKYFGKFVVYIPNNKSDHEYEYEKLDGYLTLSSKNGINGFKWFFFMFSVGLLILFLNKIGF